MPAEESRRRVNRTLGQKLVRGEHRQPEEHEAGAGAFVKAEKAEKAEKAVFGGTATGHDSTGCRPTGLHQDGVQQDQCKDRTRRPQLHRTGAVCTAAMHELFPAFFRKTKVRRKVS